jgi:hypothetical protein
VEVMNTFDSSKWVPEQLRVKDKKKSLMEAISRTQRRAEEAKANGNKRAFDCDNKILEKLKRELEKLKNQ